MPQRGRDPRRLLGGGEEQDPGQVEPQLDEGVAEGWFCAGSSTSRSTAAGAVADLVDLVEDEDRVSGPDAAQLPQDPAGLGVPPRAVVAPEVRLVAQASAGSMARRTSFGASSSWESPKWPSSRLPAFPGPDLDQDRTGAAAVDSGARRS
ncbi:MAG: hypothetical protein OXH52_15270 [Gammaproteobacteria bacterium]|nr:hypothetical protein [Gammaproteobacteria bacterium]